MSELLTPEHHQALHRRCAELKDDLVRMTEERDMLRKWGDDMEAQRDALLWSRRKA